MSLMVARGPDFPFPAPESSICVQPMNAVKRREREMVFGNNSKIFGEAVVGFLRGRHPIKTAANVAADTGCSPAQIEKWLEGVAAPSGIAFARLIAAYGPDILSAVLPPTHWITKASQDKHEVELIAARDELQRKIDDFHAAR